MVVRTEGDLSDSRASATLVIIEVDRTPSPFAAAIFQQVAAPKNGVLYVMQGMT
jgi:hypothetical protein